MKKMKIIVSFVFCALLCFGGFSEASALQREGIAAVVNDDIVSFSDVRDRMSLNLSVMRGQATPEIKKKMQEQSLEDLINEALQMQEAKKLGISITSNQVKQGVDNVAQKNGVAPADFYEQLSNAGVPATTLEDKVRAQIAWSYVVRQKLRPRVKISESEINSVFDIRQEQENQTGYRLAEIVLNGQNEEELKALASTIMNKLEAGTPFPLLAKQFSQGIGASKGGDLGWLTEEQVPEEYQYAIQKMNPGQVSPPLRTDEGYNILLMIDMREKAGAVVEKLPKNTSKTMMKTVVSKDVTLSMKQILIAISKDEPKAVIAAKMARATQLKSEINNCEVMAEKSKNFLSAGTGDIDNVKLKSLPAHVAAIVADLPIGQLSSPIQHRDGISLLMVCNRDITEITEQVEVPNESITAEIPEQLPDLEQSTGKLVYSPEDEKAREQIANGLGMQRLNRLQEHYLRDIRSAAYIDRRLY